MKAGDVFENPATGEYGYIRMGSDETGGKLLVVDLRVKPGGAVLAEHVHPWIRERFTVLSGSIGYKIDGSENVASAGETLDIPPGTAHYWWNAGEHEARVVVQISPGERFEKMALNMFGLARAKKTNSKGMPNILQMAVIANEYSDVLYLTKPPRWIQSVMFAVLAPLGELLGYKASYEEFETVYGSTEVEALSVEIKWLTTDQ